MKVEENLNSLQYQEEENGPNCQTEAMQGILKLENTNEGLISDREERNISSFDGIETTQGPMGEISSDTVKDKNSLLLLNEILKSQQRSKMTAQGMKWLKIYKQIAWLKYLIITFYLLLSFFERPFWCSERLLNEDYGESTREQIENNCDADFWPSWELPFLPLDAECILEIIFLLILLFFIFFRKLYRVSSKTGIVREWIHTVLTVIALLDIIINWALGRNHPIAAIIRPLLFISFNRQVRDSWRRVSIVLWRSKEVVILIIVFIIFFSFLGYRLFRGLGEGQAYFPTIQDGMFHLLVLLTTANYPDVMMPAYKVSRLYVLFFVAYLVIGLFFLMNMLLAVFYNNYSEQIDEIADQYLEHQKDQKGSQEGKFEMMETEGKGERNESDAEKELVVMEKKESILDLGEDRRGTMMVNAMQQTLQNASANQAAVSKEDFMRVLDTYEMLKNEQKQARMMAEKEEEFNLEELNDPDATCFDKCYVRCGKARKDSQYVLESTIYELVVNFINFVNLIALLIRDVLQAEGISYYDAWSISQIVINFLFLIDLLLRIWIHTPIPAMKINLVRFQLAIQVVMIVGFITYLRGQPEFSIKCFEFIIIIRLLRVLYMLQEVFTYNIIIETMMGLIGPFTTLLGVLMTVFYVFSILGGFIFGGKVDANLPQILANDGVSTIYIYNNFNDFGSGIVTLFELMIVNNWQVIVEMFIDATGISAVRWFFIFFYFFSVTVALNIVVAFALDLFNSYHEMLTQRRDEKQKLYEDLNDGSLPERPESNARIE